MSRAYETMSRELLEPTGKDKVSFGSKRDDRTTGAVFSTECPEKVSCELHESGHHIFLTHCAAPRPSTCLLAVTIDERVNE